MDATALNLSRSGAFLKTGDRLKVGTVLVLVLAQETATMRPIHLVARVARCQRAPVGLGLEWLRALADADGGPALRRFLDQQLGVQASWDEFTSEPGGKRITYRFDVLAPRRWARGSVPSPSPLPRRTYAAPGPVTGWVRMETSQVECSLRVRVRFGRRDVVTTAVQLGPSVIVLSGPNLPRERGQEVQLMLGVTAAGRHAVLRLRCISQGLSQLPQVTGQCARLQLQTITDPEQAQVYEQLLKALRTRDLTRRPAAPESIAHALRPPGSAQG